MLQAFISENSETILWLAGLSLGVFVGSILFLPFILIRLSADFFVRRPPARAELSVTRLCLKALKNILGAFFFFVGFIMLFIPGQGILTMLFGISLMDFPGKRRLQHRIIRMPRIHRSLDWLRHKADRPPFLLPEN